MKCITFPFKEVTGIGSSNAPFSRDSRSESRRNTSFHRVCLLQLFHRWAWAAAGSFQPGPWRAQCGVGVGGAGRPGRARRSRPKACFAFSLPVCRDPRLLSLSASRLRSSALLLTVVGNSSGRAGWVTSRRPGLGASWSGPHGVRQRGAPGAGREGRGRGALRGANRSGRGRSKNTADNRTQCGWAQPVRLRFLCDLCAWNSSLM